MYIVVISRGFRLDKRDLVWEMGFIIVINKFSFSFFMIDVCVRFK